MALVRQVWHKVPQDQQGVVVTNTGLMKVSLCLPTFLFTVFLIHAIPNHVKGSVQGRWTTHGWSSPNSSKVDIFLLIILYC